MLFQQFVKQIILTVYSCQILSTTINKNNLLQQLYSKFREMKVCPSSRISP